MQFRWLLALALVVLQLPAFAADEEFMESSTESSVSVKKMPPEVHAGLDLQYSNTVFPNYQTNPGFVGTQAGHFPQVSLEWMPFGDAIGKVGIGAGIGYFFIKKANVGGAKTETIAIYPVRGFVSYRADYFRNQILVPFGKVGVSAAWVNQTGTPGTKRFDGFDYGGGLELCLNRLDPGSSGALSQSVGIHNTYFIAEYTKTGFLDNQRAVDLTHDELRFGLRFEM